MTHASLSNHFWGKSFLAEKIMFGRRKHFWAKNIFWQKKSVAEKSFGRILNRRG